MNQKSEIRNLMSAPDVPSDWTPIHPFPRQAKRSFVTDSPDGDRLRVSYFRRGDEPVLRARVWFGPGTEGPPGYAHGGSVAAALDESIGGAAWMMGHRVVVARLVVDFRKPVPLGTDAFLESSVVNVDGRKVACRARLTSGATVLAEAEGLCVIVRNAEPAGT
jgi:acyl-coenzyme A thioesterase PaaI-like protein